MILGSMSGIAQGCKVASGMQSAVGLVRRVMLRSCFLQGCLRLMAISFPDTVSLATQFSDAAVRQDSASSEKSQLVSEGNECDHGPTRKSDKSTDEDFEAMLAWMMMMNGFGPAMAQAETTTIPGIASTSAESQEAENITGQFTSAVSVGLGNVEPPKTTEMIADQSLNGAASPIQVQSVPFSSNQHLIDGFKFRPTEPLVFSPVVGAVAARPEAQTTAFELPVVTHSGLSAIPEALSQDAIDALERIGRLPGSVISQAPSFAFPQNTPSVSASQVQASSTSTLPGEVSPVDAKLVSPDSGSELPISATLSSVQTESNEPKTPVPVSIQATSVLPAATLQPSGLAPSAPPVTGTPVMTPSAATASTAALPVADAAVTKRSVTATSEKDAASNRKPSIVVTSDQALASNSKSRVQASGAAVASKNTESMNKPVRGRLSFDAVRNDMVQPNAANSLPDLARSISSEMRQPLSHQVSQAIMEHIEGNGVRSNDTLSVRLDPPELGEMTIELSKTLEGLAVRVTAREAVTMDMLFARGQEIESHLRGQHMNLKSLEFLRADMSGNQFSQGQQQHDGSRRSENLMNQVRRGSIPANTNVGRITTPDSTYGLSFRA